MCLKSLKPLRKHAKEQHAKGNLAEDQSITEFSKKYIVEEVILRNYLQHLEYLDMNKRKRAGVRQLKMQYANNRTFEECDWLKLLKNGLLKKQKVPELNKYLNCYDMKNALKLRKNEKLRVI